MMNPMMVSKNRTARLVAEARTPTYSTATPVAPVVRDHIEAVEIGRTWHHMPSAEVEAFLSVGMRRNDLSDIDHSTRCWCFG